MREYFNNGAQTTLNGGINNSVTSATLTSASGWPEAPFRAAISDDGGTTVSEIILVGARSGTALSSIVRAYEAIADGSQTPQSHSSGAFITQVFTEGARRNTTPFVQTESRQSKRYLQRDGLWRNPLLIGNGTIAVGSATTLTDDTKYNAWPIICRLRDSRLLAVYTKGDTHHLDTTGKAIGKIGVEGLNGSISWGSEFTIYQDTSPLFASAYGATCISTGRVFVTLWKDNPSVATSGLAGYVYSDDFGVTWSAWQAFTTTFVQEAFSAGPVVELSNGDLLVTIEGTVSGTALNRSSHTLRSMDQGLTWGSEVTVRNYADDTRPYYESKLLLLDNDDLLVIHRTSASTGNIYISKSTDGGLTWAAPYLAVAGFGAPSTIQASSGTLFLTTRKNSDSSAIVYTSIDRGVTWDAGTTLDATMYEMEYACPIELLDGRILVIYGYQVTSSTSNADIKLIPFTESVTAISSTSGGGTTVGTGVAVGAKAYASTSQSLNDVVIPFDSEEFDTHGFHSTSSNTSRMTIPTGQAGKFFLFAGTFINGSGRLKFLKNGSTDIRSTGGTIGSGGYTTISAVADLADGDYVEVTGASGTTRTYGDNSEIGAQSSLTVMRVDTGPAQGTSFPSSPSTNQRFTRTDRGLDYYYDGTRWLTVSQYTISCPVAAGAGVSVGTSHYVPINDVYNLYIEKFNAIFYSSSLSGGAYWTATLYKETPIEGTTSLGTLSIASGTNTNWLPRVTTINAVVDISTYSNLFISLDKTGSPGSTYFNAFITYRLVG